MFTDKKSNERYGIFFKLILFAGAVLAVFAAAVCFYKKYIKSVNSTEDFNFEDEDFDLEDEGAIYEDLDRKDIEIPTEETEETDAE